MLTFSATERILAILFTHCLMMLRVLCMLMMVCLLIGAVIRYARSVETYVETNAVTSACPQFSMYDITEIGGTGFAPQVVASSAYSDCSLDYVRKLPGLSAESSNMAQKAKKDV